MTTTADGVFAFRRASGDDRFLVALDFSDAAGRIVAPSDGAVVVSTSLDRIERISAGDAIGLRPNEGLVLQEL
jgi:hypothetical protein